MRFVMLMYPGPAAETETNPVPPGPEGQKLLEDMMAFNQRMIDAGVMLGGEGLRPTRMGARVRYQGGGKTTVHDGPFTETKEVLGGYWIIEAANLAEVIAWARDHMANYKVPRIVRVVDALPFNAGGKVMKFELRELLDRETKQ